MLVSAEDNSGFILMSPNDVFDGNEWLICVNDGTGWFY
jgi:hypothetical protein